MKNINELLEALYKESENKDEVIEYVDLLTDYYAKYNWYNNPPPTNARWYNKKYFI